MDLSIIIVNWNSRDYLRACLDSVRASVRGLRYEVIVIDGGSRDGCAEMLRECHPDVRFIQAENIGFARANNRAFEEATGDAVLFLNPDTVVLQAAIDRMYEALRVLPGAGIIGCRLLNSDGSLQSSCVQSLPTITNQALNSNALRRVWPKSRLWGTAALFETKPTEVEGISGACMMMRRQVFAEVGRFSEDYFMYVEDMDLSSKVRSAGYRNYYVPDAVVIHHGGQSSQQAANVFAAVMLPEAIRRFLSKTRGEAYAAGYRFMMMASAVARLSMLGAARLSGLQGAANLASRQKWTAILQWSLGRDGIVERYYPDAQVNGSQR